MALDNIPDFDKIEAAFRRKNDFTPLEQPPASENPKSLPYVHKSKIPFLRSVYHLFSNMRKGYDDLRYLWQDIHSYQGRAC